MAIAVQLNELHAFIADDVDLEKYPEGLPKHLAAKSKKGQWPVDDTIYPSGSAMEKARNRSNKSQTKPMHLSVASPPAPPASKAAGPVTKATAPSKVADAKKNTNSSPPKAGLDDIALDIENTKNRLDALASQQASRLAEIAKEEEEEEAASSATTAAKLEETSQLHQQLEWGESYLKALEARTESGPAVEARRTEHLSQIKWYQHRTTDLKAAAEKMKSLTRGVLFAEKSLLKA